MCLVMSGSQEVEKTKVCYKVVLKETSGVFKSYFRKSPYKTGELALSDRRIQRAKGDCLDFQNSINRGIHVYQDLKSALLMLGFENIKEFRAYQKEAVHSRLSIIRVKCNRGDFVAKNDDERVYTKVFVLGEVK